MGVSPLHVDKPAEDSDLRGENNPETVRKHLSRRFGGIVAAYGLRGNFFQCIRNPVPTSDNPSRLDNLLTKRCFLKGAQNYLSKSEHTKLLELFVEKYVRHELPEKIEQETYRIAKHSHKNETVEETVKHSRLYSNYTNVKNSQVYLEEPEGNLFPPEQVILTDWLIAMGKDPFRKNVMFIATHSPYIVNSFLEREKKDFNLLITVPADNGRSIVKTISEEDIQRIYDSGSDVFFNFEAFV